MKLGRVVLLTLAVLLLASLQLFAAEAPSSENPASPGEQIQMDQDQTTKKQPVEQGTGDTEQNAIQQEGESEEEPVRIADPLYPWNNAMYQFNDKLYFWALKPVAQGYSAVFPEDIRVAIGNVFYTVTTPIRFVGDLLQLKIKKAGNELVRLVYNSTVGVLGMVDAAKVDLDIPRHDEDLGQTLGTYGIGHGVYIVWPFFGPSSLRDTVGLIGDGFLDPVYYITPWEASLGVKAYDKVNDTSLHIGDYEDLIEAAVDPYVAIRDAYVQHRKKQVKE